MRRGYLTQRLRLQRWSELSHRYYRLSAGQRSNRQAAKAYFLWSPHLFVGLSVVEEGDTQGLLCNSWARMSRNGWRSVVGSSGWCNTMGDFGLRGQSRR